MNKKLPKQNGNELHFPEEVQFIICVTIPSAKKYPLSHTREIVVRYCISAGCDPLSYTSNCNVKLLVGSAQAMAGEVSRLL